MYTPRSSTDPQSSERARTKLGRILMLSTSRNAPLFLLFFISNSSLLVLNKLAITAIPNASALLSVQITSTVLFVVFGSQIGAVRINYFPSATIVRSYIVVAAVWCGTIYSNLQVLHSIGVNSFIVLRCSTPLMTCVLDWLCMGRTLPSPKSALALFGIFTSSLIYSFSKFSNTHADQTKYNAGIDRSACAWCLVWLISFLTDVTYIKHVVNTHECSGLERTLYQNVFAMLFLLVPLGAKLDDNIISELVTAPKTARVALALSCVAGATLSLSGMFLRAKLSATSFTVLGIVCKFGAMVMNEIFVEPEKEVRRLSCVFAVTVFGVFYKPAPLRNDPDKHQIAITKQDLKF